MRRPEDPTPLGVASWTAEAASSSATSAAWDGDSTLRTSARLASALERIGAARRMLVQDIATRNGLSVLQVKILNHVGTTGPANITALAGALGVSMPTVSDANAALRHKGMVEQRTGADARRRTVHLTRGGRAMARRIEADLEPFRRACESAGPVGLGAALAVIHGLWREGILAVDRSCATCRHHVEGSTSVGRCDLLGIDLTTDSLRVDCPEHVSA
ncbi:MAG: MarR family winged helix-turn-helix transcriptional regulator [Dermatophilaceae bacterium]